MARLPTPGGDENNWGTVLNDFLHVSHRNDGSLRGVCPTVTAQDFGAIGDGQNDDTGPLQQAIDFAIQQGLVLDLCGKTYRFNASLLIKDNLTLVNGQLLSGGAVDTAIVAHNPSDAYLTLTVRDLTVRNLQGSNKVGFNLILGLRCTFDRCTFTDFWNGEQSRGMRIEGSVGCTFINCDWVRNHTLIEIKGRLRSSDSALIPTNDTKTWSGRLQEAQQANILISGDANNNAWHGCWVEHCNHGPLVNIRNSNHNSFHDCRMEKPGLQQAAPTVIIEANTAASNGTCWSNRIIGSVFSNTTGPGNAPVVELTGPSYNPNFPTILMANRFPMSSPPIAGSDLYKAVANTILPDKT